MVRPRRADRSRWWWYLNAALFGTAIGLVIGVAAIWGFGL